MRRGNLLVKSIENNRKTKYSAGRLPRPFRPRNDMIFCCTLLLNPS